MNTYPVCLQAKNNKVKIASYITLIGRIIACLCVFVLELLGRVETLSEISDPNGQIRLIGLLLIEFLYC